MTMTKDIKQTAIVGGGLIGTSFGLLFAMGGLPVTIWSRREESLKESEDYIKQSLKELMDMDVLTQEEAKAAEKRISYTTDLEEAVKDADYIQESLAERYDLKKEYMDKLEKIIDEDTIIGSSTSGLLITEIQKDMKHPERMIGAHPYNPPHLIPLIELSKGEKSSDEAVERAKELFIKMNKEPIILHKEMLGFVANRIQAAVLREVIDLVKKGVVSVEDADKAVTFGPGIRWGIMGPAMVFELGGGKGGLKGFIDQLGPSIELWMEDLAEWDSFPEDMDDIYEGVKEEMKNREPETGNTPEEIAKYRDKILVEFLRLHGKF